MHDAPSPLALCEMPQVIALSSVTSAMMWAGVLVCIVVVGGIAVLMFRRTLLDSDIGQGGAESFDLRSLRQMRERGEITQEEYEIARSQTIGAYSGKPDSTHKPVREGELHAEPGFDLAGDPLPDPAGIEPDAGGEEGPEK